MTRIRKNWSSSRVAEDRGASPPSHVVSHDSYTADTEGKSPSPILLQLVNEDAMHMLAAVSIESLEQDSRICTSEHDGAPANVMGLKRMNLFEHQSGRHDPQNDVISPRKWDPSLLCGSGLLSQHGKSHHWCQKLTSLWRSDQEPGSFTNTSKRERVDEEQSKSSSVADNEMVDSDLSARVKKAKQSLNLVEPMQGFISEFLHAHCLEGEPTNGETSKVLQDLVLDGATVRKKRQKPWEHESDVLVTVLDGSHPEDDSRRFVSSKGCNDGDTKRSRLKFSNSSQDQDSLDKSKTCLEDSKEGIDERDGSRSSAELDKVGTPVSGDGNQQMLNSDKVGSNADERDRLNLKSEKEDCDATDQIQVTVKSEKVEKLVDDQKTANPRNAGTDDDRRKKPRSRSQDYGTDGDTKCRSKLRKPEGDGQTGVAESIFPTGWKYKGLAQIAEKDDTTKDGQVKKLCGRTDGHNWRCPLRVVEGLSLCQHHLNKARAKKLGKSSQQKRTSELCKSDVTPAQNDSLRLKLPNDGAQRVPTKFRRRHKTAKLSVL